MILLSGAALVLPDRVISPGTVVVEDDRIVEVIEGARSPSTGSVYFDLHDHYVVPGFIDVHVHGVGGHDSHDGPDAIAEIAARLPRYGVTAFCPTTVACAPPGLRDVLAAVRRARAARSPAAARVLPAHLESNFISPDYCGAQPAHCLRLPPDTLAAQPPAVEASAALHETGTDSGEADYGGAAILAEIERARDEVGIVTLAPEVAGGLDLVRFLAARGYRVSLGHSGATFEEGLSAVAAGACHAAHLFNRMPPLGHREPGLAGAVLHTGEVAAEVICDGHHVHPAVVRTAVAAKSPSRVMAITDGTAGSGLPPGARARLGGRPITVRQSAAYLGEDTLAGSVLTMDGAFRVLVGPVGLTLPDAATVCATTPARELGLPSHGVIAPGAVADLAVLDREFKVVQTYIGGALAFSLT